ncbi:MAG: hypothetical protein KZQ89_01580 [Candidatus Thiodiazotropha sp. (ex Lucinoma kastoroae)]|nr:hypothetical protein [Candidatus Thiodiazotropha sp. (ex Lucinoma kastoroae)]
MEDEWNVEDTLDWLEKTLHGFEQLGILMEESDRDMHATASLLYDSVGKGLEEVNNLKVYVTSRKGNSQPKSRRHGHE